MDSIHLPLLSQFIRTNGEDFIFSYFGVSATSGDFEADPISRRRTSQW